MKVWLLTERYADEGPFAACSSRDAAIAKAHGHAEATSQLVDVEVFDVDGERRPAEGFRVTPSGEMQE